MSRGAQHVSAELYESLQAFDACDRVSSLACPVLCLWGDRYGDVTPEKWTQVLEAFGYAQVANLAFFTIRNSHHFVMIEQPQETQRAIRKFLSGL